MKNYSNTFKIFSEFGMIKIIFTDTLSFINNLMIKILVVIVIDFKSIQTFSNQEF